MLMFGIFFGAYVSSVFKSTAIGILDDKILTMAGILGRLSNGIARIIGGILLDKYRFKNIYLFIMIAQLIASIFLYQNRDSPVIYTILVCLSFFCEGAH